MNGKRVEVIKMFLLYSQQRKVNKTKIKSSVATFYLSVKMTDLNIWPDVISYIKAKNSGATLGVNLLPC